MRNTVISLLLVMAVVAVAAGSAPKHGGYAGRGYSTAGKDASGGGNFDTTPSTPSGLTVEVGASSAYLSWDHNQELDLASYSVYRGTSSGATSLYYAGQVDPSYTDVNATNDSTFYYAVTAIDAAGNESPKSSEVVASPVAADIVFTFYDVQDVESAPVDTTASGEILLDVTARLNVAGFVRPIFSRHDATADTAAIAWLNPASANWDGTSYPTGVTVATSASDSGGIVLSWTAGVGQDHYHLQMQYLSGAWADVDTSIAGSATSYTHNTGTSLTPTRRGKLNYRIYGATAADSLSAVAVTDSSFYNQAVGILSQFHAIADTLGPFSGIASTGSPQEYVHISRYITGPDITPPPVPSGITASGGDGKINLSWADVGGDVATYSIYRRNAAGSLALFDEGVTSSSYIDSTVPNDSTYYYTVTSLDAVPNESAQSSEVSAMATAIAAIPGSPTHHWDATDGTTITLVGSDVSVWSDKVGAWSWVEYSSTSRPSYTTSDLINGNQAIGFDGVDEIMTRSTGFIGGADYTICITYQDDGVLNTWYLMNETNSGYGRVSPLYQDTLNNIRQGPSTDSASWSPLSDADGYHTVITTFDVSAGTVSTWIDGTLVINADPGHGALTDAIAVWLGGRSTNNDVLNGLIGEVAFYSTVADAAFVTSYMTYAGRWD